MNLQEAVRSVLTQYAGFSGRARRSEYWFWTLAVLIGAIVTTIVDSVLSTTPIITLVFDLAILLPGLAVAVRRLHDISKSGWFILLALIPIVGAIILIVWFVGDSHPDNEYGPNPKGAAAPA